ncbi:MAG: amidohydrolase [Cyanobacteriota bacterium]|jgi:predicted amidohydrolase YtcJ
MRPLTIASPVPSPIRRRPVRRGAALLAVAGLMGSAAMPAARAQAVPPATLYSGGEILTMVGPRPSYAEALVERGGRILYVGPLAGARKAAGASARRVDLAGRTLLPGFIDTHGHFIYFGKNLVDADLFGASSVEDVVRRMKAQAAKVGPGEWVVGFGFNGNAMARYPSVADLDGVSADRPVMVVDSSGHAGAMNTAAFRAAGVSAATPDPAGGKFERGADGKSLAGKAEETALNLVREKRPAFSGATADAVATKASALWASYGQTTAQECGVGLGSDDIALVRNAIDKQLLSVDLYLCAKDSHVDAMASAAAKVVNDYGRLNPTADGGFQRQERLVSAGAARPGDTKGPLLRLRPDLDKRYVNRVRLGGIKFWLDGSIPTAWMSQPYATNPPGTEPGYRAYQQIPDAVLEQTFDRWWTSNVQINMHMNGDAAAEQALRAIEKAVRKHGMADHRPVFIHASYLRPDQIQRLKAVGGVPSFLTSGLVPGGDTVVKLWGAERAANAMAARSMERAGIPFTFSHDAPVSPQPWILPLIDAGVNRRTASGLVIGPEQRVSPYEGLKAVTANAAWQIKEEQTKGTLEAGKLADLVILERNPLKVDPATIKDIAVVETIKEGRTIFRREAAGSAAPSSAAGGLPCPHELVGRQGGELSPEARRTLALLEGAARGSGVELDSSGSPLPLDQGAQSSLPGVLAPLPR